jgi:hypothetical protein
MLNGLVGVSNARRTALLAGAGLISPDIPEGTLPYLLRLRLRR